MEATVYNPVLRTTVQLPVTFWGRSVSLCRWKCNNFLLPSCKSSKSLVRKKEAMTSVNLCLPLRCHLLASSPHQGMCTHVYTCVHTQTHIQTEHCHLQPHWTTRRNGDAHLLVHSTPPHATHAVPLLAMASPSFLADFSPSVENQSMWCCLREAFLPQPSRSGLVIYSCALWGSVNSPMIACFLFGSVSPIKL